MSGMGKDFNHLPEWLSRKLQGRGMSPEQLARKCKLSRATVYFYLERRIRPSTQAMASICHLLGVPLEEGLSQYTPGKPGRNLLIRAGEANPLPGKASLDAEPGDVLRIETPGGGGHGRSPRADEEQMCDSREAKKVEREAGSLV